MFDSVVSLLGEVLACGMPTPAGHDAGGTGGTGSDVSSAVLSEHDLVERIAAAERLAHAVAAAQTRDLHVLAAARLVADRARGGVGERLAGRTTPFEVALGCGVSPQSAISRLLAARRLVTDHPALLALADEGKVSAWALRLVLRHTDILDPDQCRTVDAQLAADVSAADGMRPGELEQAARRRVAAIDPDADARRCARARAERQISIRDRVDGTATLWARLKAEESVAMWTSLDGHARGRRDDGDPRSVATLMCDTLVERVTGLRVEPVPTDPAEATAADATGPTRAPGTGPDPWPVDPDLWDLDVPDPYDGHTGAEGNQRPDPSRRAPDDTGERDRDGDGVRPGWTSAEQSRLRARTELQVVLAASTLLGLDEQPGMLRGYGTIPAVLARHLADQSDTPVLRRLICDPIDGRLLSMDSRTRCYTGSSGQFLRWRDQRCRLSGAEIRDGDHIIPHAEGGATSPGNGQGLGKNPHVIRDHPDIDVHTVAYRPARGADPDPQRLLSHTQLTRLRDNAPDIIWTMPTGHTHRRPPPPTLGHGSVPRQRRHPPERRSPHRPQRPDPDDDDVP